MVELVGREATRGAVDVAGRPPAWWLKRAAAADLLRAVELANEARGGTSAAPARALAQALALLRQPPAGTTMTVAELGQLVERALGDPSRKLAVYGTLAPGEVNHAVIRDIPGAWSDGFVRGEVDHTGWGAAFGFPALTWRPAGRRVPVKLFVAEELPRHWERLDRFEGDGYRRILIPVETDVGVVAVANVYEAVPG